MATEQEEQTLLSLSKKAEELRQKLTAARNAMKTCEHNFIKAKEHLVLVNKQRPSTRREKMINATLESIRYWRKKYSLHMREHNLLFLESIGKLEHRLPQPKPFTFIRRCAFEVEEEITIMGGDDMTEKEVIGWFMGKETKTSPNITMSVYNKTIRDKKLRYDNFYDGKLNFITESHDPTKV